MKITRGKIIFFFIALLLLIPLVMDKPSHQKRYVHAFTFEQEFLTSDKPINTDNLILVNWARNTGFAVTPSFQQIATTDQRAKNDNMVADIMSISKMFTTATLLRMMEEPKYKDYFPKNIDTKLADFLPLLKKRFPNNVYMQTKLENKSHFNEITIQNLMQHTAGFSSSPEYDKINEYNSAKDRSDWFTDSDVPTSVMTKEECIEYLKETEEDMFGKYSYSDINFSLLSMIAETISGQVDKSGKEFDQLQKDLVLNQLNDENIFTNSDIVADTPLDTYDGDINRKLYVKDRPDLIVANSFIRQNDATFRPFIGSKPNRGSYGIYASANALIKFAEKYFSNDQTVSLFKTEEARKWRDINFIDKTTNPFKFDKSKTIYYLSDYDSVKNGALRGHSGGGNGIATQLRYDPIRKRGFAYITYDDCLIDRLANKKASNSKIIKNDDLIRFIARRNGLEEGIKKGDLTEQEMQRILYYQYAKGQLRLDDKELQKFFNKRDQEAAKLRKKYSPEELVEMNKKMYMKLKV